MSEILGVLFAVVVSMYMYTGILVPQRTAHETTLAITTAQQQKVVYAAGAKYLENYASQVQATATATNPAIITVPMMQAAGMNLVGINATNPYGQTWQVQVLQPTPNSLQALVVAVGGNALPDKTAALIAKYVGQPGGIIPKNDTGTYPSGAGAAYGNYGGWQIPTAYYQVSGGHPAALLTVTNGQVANNYLYRNAVPGQPQLNQMNTELGMNGYSISGVNQFIGKQGVLSVDGAGAYGGTATLNLSENTIVTGKKPAIQFHSNGRQEGYIELSGDAGEPRRFNLKDNQGVGVGLAASGQITAPSVALPGGDNLSIGSTRVYGDSLNTAIRQNGGLFSQFMDGSPGPVTARDLNATGATNTRDINLTGGRISTVGDTWAMVTQDSGSNLNNSPQNATGSLHVNDIYIRALGKWASSLGSQSLGEGQSWGDYTGARGSGGAYGNNTGRSIAVNISVTSNTGGQVVATLYVNGVTVGNYNSYNQRYNNGGNFSVVVPPNSTYQLNVSGDHALISNWSELR